MIKISKNYLLQIFKLSAMLNSRQVLFHSEGFALTAVGQQNTISIARRLRLMQ